MFATDFLFDGQRASDLGLMICSFNGEGITSSGGGIEYVAAKPAGRDQFDFYGAQAESPLEWSFSICKKPDKRKNPCFSRHEESQVAKWLLKSDGYHPIQFEQPGFEDIFYFVHIGLNPHQIAGSTVGFDLTVTSDCSYGFTELKKRTGILNYLIPLELTVCSDVGAYVLPRARIEGTGNFSIKNTYGPEIIFKNMNPDQAFVCIMDSDADRVEGLPDPDCFNWRFLRLGDGINTITTNSKSEIKLEIQYREPRRVMI